MGATVLVQPVPADALAFSPVKTDYLGLVANSLGNSATPADGFDADFASVIASLPAMDSGFSASDSAFAELADAMAGFRDTGLDDLAADLAANVAAFDGEGLDFESGVSGLSNGPALPQIPGDITLPSFNVATGIPTLPPAPNPPVTGTKPGKPPAEGSPPPIIPPIGEPLPSHCNPLAQQAGFIDLRANTPLCTSAYGQPIPCPCGCDPITDPNCANLNVGSFEEQ